MIPSFTTKALDCQIGWWVTAPDYNYGQIVRIERGVGLGKVTFEFSNGDQRTYYNATRIRVWHLS